MGNNGNINYNVKPPNVTLQTTDTKMFDDNAIYAYYEKSGVGFIRHIENKTVVMSHYPEYRNEQKSNSKASYWKDAWINREVYRSSGSSDMG